MTSKIAQIAKNEEICRSCCDNMTQPNGMHGIIEMLANSN